ncbi:hypothetical protein MTYP_01982 [Methylophilaceae bacterium]|nr:hypothetical protein MTYP_01982 [Methylophilaceae bacterium]
MLSRWLPARNNPVLPSASLALLISILLHLILLGFIRVDLNMFEPAQEVVEVRFARLVKEAPLPKAEKPPESRPEPAVAEPVAPEPLLDDQPLAPEALPQEQAVPVISESGPVSSELPGEPVPVVPEIAEEQPQPLAYVETGFDILRGINGSKIGRSHIRYQSREDGSYLLESVSEAKGLMTLFIPGKLVQRSEGAVSEKGLQPSSFLYEFGSAGNKSQRAFFDWKNQRITLQTSKGSQTMTLQEGVQDLLSFMYQFMFVPPLEQMELSITNGKRLKSYSYSFAGEEELSTKIGVVRAMHIENVNDDGDEKTEIWLAVDYRFLPVKIRKTEKDGSVIEQVMTDIKTDILQ